MWLSLLASVAHASEGGGFTIGEIWAASGLIARAVIVTLVCMGFASLYVFVERVIAFRKARLESMELAAEIVTSLQQGDVDQALTLTRDEAFKSSYLAAVLRAGLVELAHRVDDHGLRSADRAVDKAIVEEQGKLRRGMAILATTGSTAPFVGLFGTTFGVINAFQGMATAGSGLASISKGISEALITTGVGIGVAVIGVWIFNYFNGRIDKVADEMATSKADFMDWAYKMVIERQEAARRASK